MPSAVSVVVWWMYRAARTRPTMPMSRHRRGLPWSSTALNILASAPPAMFHQGFQRLERWWGDDPDRYRLAGGAVVDAMRARAGEIEAIAALQGEALLLELHLQCA